jgi:hypothetical protein
MNEQPTLVDRPTEEALQVIREHLAAARDVATGQLARYRVLARSEPAA